MSDATEKKEEHTLRDVVIGTLVLVVAGCIAVFANIPTRVSVVESRLDNTERNISAQLADIQSRLPR